MLEAAEAIKKFLEFEQRASAKRSTQIDRIKEDREFLSGEQWDENDDGLISKKRCRRTVNIISNGIWSVCNQFADYPYKWYAAEEKVDTVLDSFLKTGGNQRAAYDALGSVVAFGLGYFALGSESALDENNNEVEIPSLYNIDRLENVLYDPDSVSPTGEDAMECAIIEMRSKNYIRAKYGNDWATPNGTRSIVNVTDNKDSDQMPIVTYYRIEDGRCVVYRLLNNDFLDPPVILNLSRVPVFPVYGEKVWHNGDIIYQGLVRKSAPVQKLINYAYTQLSERMAYAPKPVFMTVGEAIEDLDDGWKNFANNLNPLLLYKNKSEDQKIEYPKPERLDNTMQYGDITGIIQSNLDLMTTITGVDAKGFLDAAPERTATEVILNAKNVQNTTRHYFQSLRDSFKAVGECVCQLLNLGNVALEVVQGPGEYLEKQVARQELLTLAGIVPENDKMKIVDGILLSHNDNAILRNVFGALHASPEPTPMEQQAFNTIEQMKQALDEKTQEIQELQDQLKSYENYMNNSDKSIQADLLKEQMKHENKMEEIALQADLNNGGDTVKAMAEADKAQLDLEKTAIQLDTTMVKANADKLKIGADVAKTLGMGMGVI